jgi:glycosyltransferase involved in cell wall biosynthesis
MIDEVLPRVWRERPDVLLQVVGRGNVRWLRERAAADPRISVAENVPDVAPYYRAAAAAVAPVQYGGGTRIKVLEALAFGRGLVSTTFAAEGCGLVDGTHVVYANDPAAFAAKCLALLAAPAERERLGAAGRAFVRAHYDWDVIEGRVAEIAAMTASRMAGSRMTAGRG